MPKTIVNGVERDMTAEEAAAIQSSTPTEDTLRQGIADNETGKAFALATVDLVLALRDGTLDGLTNQQVRQAYRGRILFHLGG